jgi:hypothetical protein
MRRICPVGGGAEVRDVKIAVRAECHTGGNRKPGGYIFDISGALRRTTLPSPGAGRPEAAESSSIPVEYLRCSSKAEQMAAEGEMRRDSLILQGYASICPYAATGHLSHHGPV